MSETRGTHGVRGQAAMRIKKLLSMEERRQRNSMAKLRHGIGKKPGDDPALWEYVFDGLPADMMSWNGKPSEEEWAIYTALTLFALHQQGHDPHNEPMNVKGRSLGGAAAMLVEAQAAKGQTEAQITDEQRETVRDRVARRFNQVATAESIEALAYYLRQMIQLFHDESIGLDYANLAADLYDYQYFERAHDVRLRWGEDFYRRPKAENDDDGKE